MKRFAIQLWKKPGVYMEKWYAEFKTFIACNLGISVFEELCMH